MTALALRHSDEAIALLTLFKAMKPEVKEEVRELIVNEQETAEDEVTTDMMTAVSMDAFGDIWDAPENDHWDEFIKKRLNV